MIMFKLKTSENLGMNGYKYALEHYNQDNIVNQLEHLLLREIK